MALATHGVQPMETQATMMSMPCRLALGNGAPALQTRSRSKLDPLVRTTRAFNSEKFTAHSASMTSLSHQPVKLYNLFCYLCAGRTAGRTNAPCATITIVIDIVASWLTARRIANGYLSL